MADRIRLGVSWQTLFSDNLGVCALAHANLAIASAAAKRVGADLEVIEFCSAPSGREPGSPWNVRRADPLSLRRILLGQSQVLSQIRECDLMLDIGEGDSFADIYGFKRFMLLALSKWLTQRLSVPLVLAPQTIGPFNSQLAREVASYLMRHAHRVFPRDGLSMAYLKEIGAAAKAEEVIDVAFRLPFDPQPKPTDNKVHVGVNVSGLLYSGGYTRRNQFGLRADYAAMIDQLLGTLVARSDVVVHLVPHVLSDGLAVEDDFRVCQRLASLHPSILLSPKFTSPSEAKTYISGLHYFTGARMHACIAAFSGGVPVTPMGYSRKFNGLFSSLGYGALADLRTDDAVACCQKVLDGLEQLPQLADKVRHGNALAHQKLQRYEDYLVQLFESLSGRAN